MIDTIVHVLLAVALPPLLLGVIAKTKAFLAGRAGAPLLQPYHDLIKLFRKGSVFSTTTTWVFRAGPVVGLATAALAVLLVPLAGHPAPLHFAGDLVLLVYLLALGRFFTAAAALDTGSAFEGMGAAREVTFACLAEPAFFFGLLAVARLSGGALSLTDVLGGRLAGAWATAGAALASGWTTAGASLALVLLSWGIVLLAENCRIPFDDPNTHLELTMIHEVMVLDHGGPPLALILYSAAMKLFVFCAVVIGVAAPMLGGFDPWVAWVVFVAASLLIAIVIGLVESVMARLRLQQIPNLLVAASLMSAFGAILLMR